jgi:hypothetical protein
MISLKSIKSFHLQCFVYNTQVGCVCVCVCVCVVGVTGNNWSVNCFTDFICNIQLVGLLSFPPSDWLADLSVGSIHEILVLLVYVAYSIL